MGRQQKKKTKPKVPAPQKTSALALYIVKRLFIFNVTSAAMFLFSGVILLRDLSGAEQRLSDVPPTIRWLFIGAWITSTLYRLYLSKTRNPQIRNLMLRDSAIRSYATTQTISTLVSLLFATVALVYLSGLLLPAANTIAVYLHGLNPKVVFVVMSVLGPIFLNILSCALWDLIKRIFAKSKGHR